MVRDTCSSSAFRWRDVRMATPAGPWQRAGPWRQTVVRGQPRRRCREVKPFATEKMHCWSFTKCEEGARVEMMVGDWNKEQFQAEVEAHDDIIGHMNAES